MNPSPDHEHRLERLVHRALRELPDQPAPASLAGRVLAAAARLERRTWWRRSFAHWPRPARAAFLLLTAALAGSAAWAGLAAASLRLAVPSGWLDLGAAGQVGAALRALAGTADIFLRNVPPWWLHGTLVALVVVHAVLLAVGAAACRAFRPASAT